MKQTWISGALLLLVMVLPSAAFAQDALYDPDPPPGSAFVRVLNAAATAAQTSLGERDYGSVAGYSATAYRVVAKGTQALKHGSAAASFDLAEGSFYTVVLPASGAPALLTDPVLSSRAKALVAFYNLGGEGVWDLKTADGSVPLITGVSAPGVGSREVNGIKVDLAGFSGDTASPTVAAIQLERGNAYSFFLFATTEGLRSAWVQNTTSTR